MAWIVLIFSMSSQHASESSLLSGAITSAIDHVFIKLHIVIDSSLLHTFIRKLAHVLSYFCLASFIVLAISKEDRSHKKTIIISFLLALLVASLDELYQLSIPGRSGELRDVFIDSIGITIGIVLTIKIKKMIVYIEV